MKLKSGDKVIITGINRKTELFERSTLEKLYEQKYPVTVFITIDVTTNGIELCFNTPNEWIYDFSPGIWTLNYFYYSPYYKKELKYLL